MNIKDVDKSEFKAPGESGKVLPLIFKAQEELMVKYQEIERMPPWPMGFQAKPSQLWFKDFLWRVNEEISEAMEALFEIPGCKSTDLLHAHTTHFFEEISDAIHFLVELMIIAGVPSRTPGVSVDVLVATEDLFSNAGRPPICSNLGSSFFCTPDSLLFDGNGELVPMEALQISNSISIRALELESMIAADQCSQIQYQLGLAGNVLKNKRWKQTDVVSDKGAFDAKVCTVAKKVFLMLMQCGFRTDDIYLLYMAKKKVNQWRQETNY